MSQNDTLENMSQKQKAALLSLLNGSSQAEAANIANVHIRTVKRWLVSDSFKDALNDSIGSAVALSAARLAALSDKAINVLSTVMESETATESQRLRAANFALLHLMKLGEYASIEERIKAIESRLESLDSPQSDDQQRQG